ncbi:MAG: D-amino acid aminotransferase [Thiobacillaceae bacterium]|nr:D-amino acid aminotransferase [Thiobacillaceae bacterium]
MIVYLNGDYLPLEQARVSVLDRGFLFGDGVYEVIPVYARRPFRLHEHLARLAASLQAIRLDNPLTAAQWVERIERICTLAPWPDQGIYLQVTRGPGPRDHAFPAEVHPTVFIMPMPLTTPPREWIEHGVCAITAADERWLRCDVKSISLLANVLARQRSVDAGCAETILLRDGWLTEGASSNVFIVLDGVICAPPKSHLMLPGITYDVVLELARESGLPVQLRPIAEAELKAAAEVWLTSSPKEVLAVTRLDWQPVGEGRPGPLYRRMYAAYQDFKRRAMHGG